MRKLINRAKEWLKKPAPKWLYKLLKPIDDAYKWVREQISNTRGLIRGLWSLYIRKPDKIRIFYGFWHWDISKAYARKRFKHYPPHLDKKGKDQGVFAYNDVALLVISLKEVKLLMKRGAIDRQNSYKKTFKRDNLYLVTQIKSKQHEITR